MSGHGLRRWHRWLGMGSLIFVVLLSVTGIALNHSGELELDQRQVRWTWLLNWYGMEVPPATASFATGEHRVTLLGERLYFDDDELAERISGLIGAITIPRFIAVATPDSVLLLTRSGALVERIALAGDLPGPIQAIGTARGTLIVRSNEALYQADAEILGFDPCSDITDADVQWSEPSEVPAGQVSSLYDAYRGTGVSVERLITDLHSGRLFTGAGPILMDVVGVILVALSVFGILLWVRGGPRGPVNGNGNGKKPKR